MINTEKMQINNSSSNTSMAIPKPKPKQQHVSAKVNDYRKVGFCLNWFFFICIFNICILLFKRIQNH